MHAKSSIMTEKIQGTFDIMDRIILWREEAKVVCRDQFVSLAHVQLQDE